MASGICEFLDIAHSLEPGILKIYSIYKDAAKLLCNRKPIEEQAIENASDATLRLEKVTTFKQIGQFTKTKNNRIWSKAEHSASISGIISKKIHLPRKP